MSLVSRVLITSDVNRDIFPRIARNHRGRLATIAGQRVRTEFSVI